MCVFCFLLTRHRFSQKSPSAHGPATRCVRAAGPLRFRTQHRHGTWRCGCANWRLTCVFTCCSTCYPLFATYYYFRAGTIFAKQRPGKTHSPIVVLLFSNLCGRIGAHDDANSFEPPSPVKPHRAAPRVNTIDLVPRDVQKQVC